MLSLPSKILSMNPSTLRDSRTGNWRPRSLGAFSLLLTTSTTALLLLVFASLHYLSQSNGALLRSSKELALSTGVLLSIRYLPTIIVVSYSLWISTIDLDIRRLEPWYRLSKPAAEDRSSPLLCKYDTDFILSVFWNALLSRHWAVVGSSVLLITTSVLLPAALNSAFTTRKEFVTYNVEIGQTLQLASLERQNTQVYNNFLLIAYAITWLGQRVPRFTTQEYALAPFASGSSQLASGPDSYLSLQNASVSSPEVYITYPTKRYWTELECWSPTAVTINLTTSSVSFDSGRGCFAANMLSFDTSITDQYTSDAEFEAYVFGPGSKGYDPFIPSLQTQCAGSPHLFLMTFRRAGSSLPAFEQSGNATAMFCEPSYRSESVNATVVASNSTVVSYIITGPQLTLSEREFNTTRFEYIITNGAPPRKDVFNNLTLIVDINDAGYVIQAPRIGDMGIITPMQASGDVTIGFALGITKLRAEEYLDFDTLSAAYRKAHQLLFAQAISYSFLDVSSSPSLLAADFTSITPDSQTAHLTLLGNTIQIVPVFAIATELCLTVAISIFLVLLLKMPQRVLHLKRNPDSLAEAMILSCDDSVQQVFQSLGSSTEKHLNAAVSIERFRLDASSGLLMSEPMGKKDAKTVLTELHVLDRSNASLSQPIEISRPASSLVVVFVSSGLIGLVFIYFKITTNNGVSLTSTSNNMTQLLLNFVPTAAVTLLGMYLSLVCRVSSFIQPMQNLAEGNAVADNTLFAKYSTQPPQLLGLSAFRSKHYLLGILSIAVLGSGLLTVTAAGIFTVREVETSLLIPLNVDSNMNFANTTANTKDRIGILNDKLDSDAMYSNYANLTVNMPLNSWTTPEYAIVPRDLIYRNLSTYIFDVDAYSSSMECFDFSRPPTGVQTSLDFFSNGSTLTLFANYTRKDNTISSCTFNHANYVGLPSLGILSTSNSALELATTLLRWNASGAFPDDFCDQKILKGWIRGRRAGPNLDAAMPLEFNSTIAMCEASLQKQMVHVITTAEGNVVSVKPLTEPITISDPSNALRTSLNISIVNMRANTNTPNWHNDTCAQDWPNRLFVELIGNRDWLNATLQPPSYDSVIDTTSKLFKTLFAVQVSADRNRLVFANMLSGSGDNSQSVTSSSETSSPAQALRNERRIFISKPNFIISMVILAFDLLVLVTFQLTLPKPFLPCMPFTIASQIAFFSNSHILNDLSEQKLDLRGFRYGYGKFVGKDGRVHVGIEREPFVYPLEHIIETSERRRFTP